MLGGKVVTLSDSDGFIHDPAGMTLEKINWVKQLKTVRARADQRVCRCVPGLDPFTQTRRRGACRATSPFRAPRRMNCCGADARLLVANGCKAVSEGANMPTDLEGVHVFKRCPHPVRAGQGCQRRGRRRVRA
jgi:glutamate dehydrogenase (NADP+)